jgi:hypothetical protein
MCRRIPAINPISAILIKTLVPIKAAQWLKVSPSSEKMIMPFIVQCTIKKVIRNKPVKPMMYFLPIEEVKNRFHVISQEG